jgi:hypothetical protein
LENVAPSNLRLTGYKIEGFAKVKNFKEPFICTQPFIDSTGKPIKCVELTTVVLE